MLRAQHAQAGTDTPQASQYIQRRRLLHLKQQEHSRTSQVSQSSQQLHVLHAFTTWHVLYSCLLQHASVFISRSPHTIACGRYIVTIQSAQPQNVAQFLLRSDLAGCVLRPSTRQASHPRSQQLTTAHCRKVCPTGLRTPLCAELSSRREASHPGPQLLTEAPLPLQAGTSSCIK